MSLTRFILVAAAVAVTFTLATPAEAKLFKFKKADAVQEPEALPSTIVGPQFPTADGPLVPGRVYSQPQPYAAYYADSYQPEVVAPMPMPAPVMAAPCCPTPCISYRHAMLPLRKVKGNPCLPPTKLVLCVKDPCTCCPVSVPVCLPNCCCGEPEVKCSKTILKGHVTTFSWCCGVSVVVRFDRCGDVLVTYHGA